MEAKVDLLIPLLSGYHEAWSECVDAATELNGIPVHLFAYNDGGGADAETAIKTMFSTLHRKGSKVIKTTALGAGGQLFATKSVNRLITACLEKSRAEYVVVLHPCVIVESRHWIDTLLQPFPLDKNGAIVTSMMKGLASVRPWKVPRPAGGRLRISAFRKVALRKVGHLPDVRPDDLHGELEGWEDAAIAKSWNCWRETRIKAAERVFAEPLFSERAFSEIGRRSKGEALVFVDS